LTLPPTSIRSAAERRALLDGLQAEALLAKLKAEAGILGVDTRKRYQDIWLAPFVAFGAGGVLVAAITTLLAFVLKWLQH
jgi:hypothetical protein